MDILSTAISEELKERSVSKTALAKMLGLNRTSIYKRFNGEVIWKDLELKELSRVWAIPIERFFILKSSVKNINTNE